MTRRLRPLEADDAPALAALHAGGFERAWPEADFRRWLSGGEAYGALGFAEGEPAAFAIVRDAGEDAELLSIATLAAWRGRGWGGAVLRAAAEMAAKRGRIRMILEVSVANRPALGLYSAAGFMEIGRRKGYYREAGGAVDALVMACPLGLASPGATN